MSLLTRFRVEKLHGRRTMDVPLSDDCLVLVGENGTGKSTLANLIYYFVTCQWSRLRQYQFESISAELGGEQITLTFEQVEVLSIRNSSRHSSFMDLPAYAMSAFERALMSIPHTELLSPDTLRRISREVDLPPSVVRTLIQRRFEDETKENPELAMLPDRIRKLVDGQVLYLPTYRRIEQDLTSIFRGNDEEVRRFRDRLLTRTRQPGYIELVEFGMEDVERTIQERMIRIKEAVRNGLNNLTGTYLRDVIRGVHKNVTVELLRGIEPETVDSLFDRIDEAVLHAGDKERLRKMIDDLRSDGDIEPHDKVIAHFLSKLVELYQKQQEDEREVREFVKVCNDYLVGKQVVYDHRNYRIAICHQDDSGVVSNDEIKMSMLSSGEKQIVSFFSHLYLSEASRFFVIIDEPELSLSVPWQKRFLPDIADSQRCIGLLAVTHSPFIFDNRFDQYVHSLSEFLED